MSNCDIVIPVWNQLENTVECVESIERNTFYHWRLIIIDNASDAETAHYLDELKIRLGSKKLILVKNKKNEGFIKAVNKGIGLSTAEFVCILNNDTTVYARWLEEMISVISKDSQTGIVNPSSNTLGQHTPPDTHSLRSGPPYVELGSAFGFCMLARRRLFDEIGLFDTAYGMGNFEDTDFSLRAKEKGYRCVRAIYAYVHHKESRSFKLIRTFRRDFDKNKKIFEAKWGRTLRTIVVFRDVNAGSLSHLSNILKRHAKEKSWVYVIAPRFDTKKFYERHSNLTFYHFKKPFYTLAFQKIIFKKKKPDLVYCDSNTFSNFLRASRAFHKADVKMLEEVAL